MGYRSKYGKLLHEIANEADQIALKYFRALELQVERKKDGTAVTQADHEVEEMARARVAATFSARRWAADRLLGREANRGLSLIRLMARKNFPAGFPRSERSWA
jgi:fructose-1,6-bisphosphatase/inositol monophosphatase family enzyme